MIDQFARDREKERKVELTMPGARVRNDDEMKIASKRGSVHE